MSAEIAPGYELPFYRPAVGRDGLYHAEIRILNTEPAAKSITLGTLAAFSMGSRVGSVAC